MSVERQSGKPPAPLRDLPTAPVEVEHVWGWYLELHNRRRSKGGVEWSEIDAWARVHGHELTPLEVRALKAFDDAYLEYQRQQAESEGG